VTRVYVDLETLLASAGESRAVDGDAIRALDHLTEAGHEVVLVADRAVPAALGGLAATTVAAAPTEPSSTTWYFTSDVDRCRGRSARLRTVLVGRAPAPTAIHRCDALARDVLAAVLEVLAAEAMPPP
jgi:hypothetical protein